MADATRAAADPVVSSEGEALILVDEQDREIGQRSKADCHDGTGILHRAFSLFIFNERGELLLQQRSAQKRLWPLYWSNSCCSHPRVGESMSEATQRRLEQELGLHSDLHFLYKFQYHARYGEAGSERELCWVYLGRSSDTAQPNRNEIAACRFLSVQALDAELERDPDAFTPWFKLEWQQIKAQHAADLARFVGP